MNKVLSWFLTFNFINIAWVFFRAADWNSAVNVIKGMAGCNGIVLSPNLAESIFWRKMTVAGVSFGEWREHLPSAEPYVYFLGLLLIPIVLITKNSNDRLNGFFSYLENACGA